MKFINYHFKKSFENFKTVFVLLLTLTELSGLEKLCQARIYFLNFIVTIIKYVN